MGYSTGELKVPLRVSSHNSEQDKRDREAVDELRHDIEQLILSDDRYMRVASLGVEGGA